MGGIAGAAMIDDGGWMLDEVCGMRNAHGGGQNRMPEVRKNARCSFTETDGVGYNGGGGTAAVVNR